MNYDVKLNNNIPNGVELNSNSEVLNVFLHSFSAEQLIDLMLCLINNEGYIGDPKGLILYHELDAEDIVTGNTFEQDEIKVYHHYFGEITIKKDIFIVIFIDYLSVMNKMYKNIYFNNTFKEFYTTFHDRTLKD